MEDSRKGKISIQTGAVVEFVKTTLKGEISIGKGTVVHPTVQIIAEGGPIIIGENNLLEEGVIIHNVRDPSATEDKMVIGDYNVFEVRSQSKAKIVGNNNVLQMTASLDENVAVGNGCVIGVGLHLCDTQLEDNSHYYLQDGMILQRTSKDIPQVQTQQLEYLRNMIPNYHKIYKPNKT